MQRALRHKEWFYKPKGLVLNINSEGGSVVQAINMAKLLRRYAKENDIPFYTIAENTCLGEANILLCSGHKCFVNPYI